MNESHPTEIKCAPCGGVQTVYSCRRGTSLAVGIPTECPTKHECRRVVHAVLDDAKERALDHLKQWANNADPITDIARAADFIANQPYSASGTVAQELKEHYRDRRIETDYIAVLPKRDITVAHTGPGKFCIGFDPPLLKPRGVMVTSELVNKLLNEEDDNA